jgi:hypothetical protein
MKWLALALALSACVPPRVPAPEPCDATEPELLCAPCQLCEPCELPRLRRPPSRPPGLVDGRESYVLAAAYILQLEEWAAEAVARCGGKR